VVNTLVYDGRLEEVSAAILERWSLLAVDMCALLMKLLCNSIRSKAPC
jgi:hypothetical protein